MFRHLNLRHAAALVLNAAYILLGAIVVSGYSRTRAAIGHYFGDLSSAGIALGAVALLVGVCVVAYYLNARGHHAIGTGLMVALVIVAGIIGFRWIPMSHVAMPIIAIVVVLFFLWSQLATTRWLLSRR